MKIKTIIFCAFLAMMFFISCNSKLCLEKRTNKQIEKSQKIADTIYLYSVAFNDFNLVWYHKDDFIYSFWVKPHRTEKRKPIEAKNITVNKNDSISKYFGNFFFKEIQCFESVLDGASIELYVRGYKSVMSSIDMYCLFKTKFEQNTFPYKLQYDFSKIWKSKDFDFNKLYPQN